MEFVLRLLHGLHGFDGFTYPLDGLMTNIFAENLEAGREQFRAVGIHLPNKA